MSVQSELERLQANVASISSAANDILSVLSSKGVTVPPGATLHDVPGLIGMIDGRAPVPVPTVVIGGRTYVTVTIGNQEWMTENLDYQFDGLTISNGVSSSAAYGTYGGQSGFGLFYNGVAARLLEANKTTLLPDGWRVPTQGDLNGLLSAGGTNASELRTADGWPSGYEGTNGTGFSAYPCGRFANNTIYQYGMVAQFWSCTLSGDSGYQMDLHLEPGFFAVGSQSYSAFLKIRLVKDLE